MAKRTYTGTLFNPDLTKATILLHMYKGLKYGTDEEPKMVKLRNIKSWSIIEGGPEAEEAKKRCVADENEDYLVLDYVNGDQVIYPNSHVAMFIL